MYAFMLGFSRFMTWLGGAVLVVLIFISGISIAGRLLNGFFHGAFMKSLAPGFAEWAIAAGVGPVTGDFELVEAGMAFAVFAFLPLCQITAGHATVDVFAGFLPSGVNRFLRMVIEIVFAAVLVVIAVQLFSGMLDKMKNGETSFLIAYPIWWAYAFSLFAAAAAAIVALYMAAVRTYEFLTRRTLIADGTEV
ncbi:MAG: TRAP transporter small permease subunit [Pseudooceanicola sp.]|nr:TRAP transporter small permease subunit [Pseudooceanicola sp.]